MSKFKTEEYCPMTGEFTDCCNHPTTLIFVDDDEQFLEFTTLKLRRNFACKNFMSSREAAQFLTQEYQPHPFTQHSLLLSSEDNNFEQENLTINVNAIHQEIYNAARFDDISVVIVDYAMPGMNGLELCQQVKKPIKKILLTGEADEKLATEAFNKEIIHRFIRKDDPQLSEKLQIAIRELQNGYFRDLCRIVIEAIHKNSLYRTICLDDPIFINFFNKLIKKYNFVEYYLMESIGSFLCLDAEGKPTIFAVTNDDMMDTYYRAAVDHNASESIVTAIKNKKMFPFFYSQEDYQRNPSEWKSYLHPAHVLSGKNTYFYSIITDTKIYDIQREKIKSYHQFLDQFYQDP
jgi:CheY-like chemotaxis protein